MLPITTHGEKWDSTYGIWARSVAFLHRDLSAGAPRASWIEG
jgi:hypothetical protein